MYVCMSAAAKYATESKHLGTPGTGSTCPCRYHYGRGKASRQTSSPTCVSHRHRATPGSSTLNDATGTSIISYNGQVTVTYWVAGNLRRISGMRRSWLMSFTESIRGSLDDDWTFSTGVLLCLLSYGSRAGINAVGTGFYHLPLGDEFPGALNPPWGWS